MRSARFILLIAWSLVVVPSVILVSWTTDIRLKIAGVLAAGAVVLILVAQGTRASVAAILSSLIGTCVVDGLANSLSAGARASATGLFVGLGVYGIMRGRAAQSAG